MRIDLGRALAKAIARVGLYGGRGGHAIRGLRRENADSPDTNKIIYYASLLFRARLRGCHFRAPCSVFLSRYPHLGDTESMSNRCSCLCERGEGVGSRACSQGFVCVRWLWKLSDSGTWTRSRRVLFRPAPAISVAMEFFDLLDPNIAGVRGRPD